MYTKRWLNLGFVKHSSVSVQAHGRFPCDVHFSHTAILTDLEVSFGNDSKGWRLIWKVIQEKWRSVKSRLFIYKINRLPTRFQLASCNCVTPFYLLTYLFTYLLIYLLTYLLIYLLTYLFTYLVLIYLLTYLLTYLFTYILTYVLTCSK